MNDQWSRAAAAIRALSVSIPPEPDAEAVVEAIAETLAGISACAWPCEAHAFDAPPSTDHCQCRYEARAVLAALAAANLLRS